MVGYSLRSFCLGYVSFVDLSKVFEVKFKFLGLICIILGVLGSWGWFELREWRFWVVLWIVGD